MSQDTITATGIVTETTTVSTGLGESTTIDGSSTYAVTETSTTGPATTSEPGTSTTEAEPVCGDGQQTPDEECDKGEANDGAYGGCNEDCTLAPRCGDGVVDNGHEVCDGGEGCPVDCGISACKMLGG